MFTTWTNFTSNPCHFLPALSRSHPVASLRWPKERRKGEAGCVCGENAEELSSYFAFRGGVRGGASSEGGNICSCALLLHSNNSHQIASMACLALTATRLGSHSHSNPSLHATPRPSHSPGPTRCATCVALAPFPLPASHRLPLRFARRATPLCG